MTKRRLRFDATGFDVPVNPPTTLEILEHGTADEIREVLIGIGVRLEYGSTIGPGEAAWLGKALQVIGDGVPVPDPDNPGKFIRKFISADAALSLKPNKRKFGVYHARAVEHMISTAEGCGRNEAEQLVARYDHASGSLQDDRDDSAVDRLKKRLQRQEKKSRQT